MKDPRSQVKRHIGSFRYSGQTIPFKYWSHLHSGEVPDAIVFLGTGQTGYIAKWAAEAASSGVIVVEGAPHWHAHSSGEDIPDFVYGFTRAAVSAVFKEFAITSAHLIAQSQAAPAIVRLGKDYPDKVNNIVLISPLGFVANIFGNTPEERVRTLIHRARRTLLQLSQSPFYDPRNIYVGFMMLRAILLESERGASQRKYATGLSYDVRDDLRILVERQADQGKTVSLLIGGRDKVFTASEILPLVEAAAINGLQTQVLPGVSHLSLGVRGAKKVLRTALDDVRKASLASGD
jgi:pimeloyl-ACP methyl ester carboxylesterase